MRTFVILLLLANLSYLALNLFLPQETESLMVRAPSRQAAQTLQLLSDIAILEIPELNVPQTCISLGVFDDTEESDFLVSTLLERGLQASAELLTTEGTANYRVYMPPFNSENASSQILADLQENDIESFIITTGNLSGGISLGLFSQEILALGLQERLAAQGFATSIQVIATTNHDIWVTIEGLSQELLEGSELLDLLSEGLELEVIEKPCETIASSQ